MATESLIVELDARTSKLEASLKQTQKQLDQLDDKVTKTDKSFSNFTQTATRAAFAVTAVAAAVSVAINQATQFARELDVASNRAGVSVEEMQSLAFATNTVGISLESLGDISKDTNEKIGEFLATGGGGFMDFVDVMGLTQIQARELAEQFEQMSGPDVLQEMTNRMQEAGISSERMSFALEGLASDATDLLPLLKDNGEALGALESEFNDLNVTISKADLQKIKEVGIELDKATTTFSQEGKQLVADYSDELIKAITATVTIAQKTSDVFNVITTGFGNLIDVAGAALNDFVNGTDTFGDTLRDRTEESKEVLNELFGEDFYELGVNAGKSLTDGINDGLSEEPFEIIIKGGKQLTEWEKLNSKQRLDIQSKYIKAASILSSEFLEENKAINAGLVVADTAAGIMKAFATSSNIYEGFANAAIVAATGLVQLNNVLSATKGGGSVGGGSTGAVSQGGQQQGFEQETSTLDLTEQSETGITTQRLIISTEGGDDIFDGIASGLEERARLGR